MRSVSNSVRFGQPEVMNFDDDTMAGNAATGYTDEFLDAAVSKLDSLFGRGYAKDHPELIAAYLATSATNLSTFIHSAIAMQPAEGWEDLLASIDEDELTEN